MLRDLRHLLAFEALHRVWEALMRRGEHHRKANLSSKRAEAALIMLLTGCTAERLASFTAAALAGSYNVSVAKCEALLSQARQGWLV